MFAAVPFDANSQHEVLTLPGIIIARDVIGKFTYH